MKHVYPLLSLLLACTELSAQPYFRLDSIFGDSGHVIPQYPGHDRGQAIVVQSDQKIVVAGYHNSSCIVARFLPNGAPDLAFGLGGTIAFNFGTTSPTEGNALALLPDGKILVAGGARAPYDGLGLARLLPNGRLDSTFAGDGMLLTAATADNYNLQSAQALGVSTIDGKITVTASCDTVLNYDRQCAVLRFLPDGTPDASFGTAGAARINITPVNSSGSTEMPRALLLQPGGAVVIAGNRGANAIENCFLARLLPGGALDPAFGTGGVVTTFGTEFLDLVQLPGNKLLAAGYDNSGQKHILLARYLASGTLDASFGAGGIAVSSNGWHHGNGVAVQPDGRIVVAGFYRTGSLIIGYTYRFLVARFTSNGEADATFAPNAGRLAWLINGDDEELHKVALQSNGDIVSVGYYYSSAGFDDLVLTRLTRDGAAQLPPGACFTAEGTGGCAPYSTSFFADCSSDAASYAWEFPGGSPASSTEANPVVVYGAAGVYPVTLTVSNAAGSNVLTLPGLITVGAAPTADFTVDIDGATATFTQLSTDAITYAWTFGDGGTSTAANPTHTYTSDGMHTVTLTATNACGTATSIQNVTIVTPPTAAFTATNTTGCTPLAVQFTFTGSANATSYSWAFPGGDPATSTAANPTVIYTTAGTYAVTLTASNSVGSATATQAGFVNVQDAPTADFTVTDSAGTFQFTNMSQQASDFLWDFGDGTTSTAVSPAHVFGSPGTFTVTLTATNSCGESSVQMVVEVLTVGVDQVGRMWSGVRLYPNPTSGEFTLELPAGETTGLELTLHDVAGRQQQTGRIEWTQAGHLTHCRLMNAVPGIYLLQVRTATAQTAFRLVVTQ